MNQKAGQQRGLAFLPLSTNEMKGTEQVDADAKKK